MMNALWGISVLPDLIGVEQRSKYDQAMSQSRIAVSQIMQYVKGRGVCPTSLKVLRESGYTKVQEKDPWGNGWILSPALSAGSQPKPTDDVYIYSKGPRGTGTYKPAISDTGEDSAVGFSLRHGAFKGC